MAPAADTPARPPDPANLARTRPTRDSTRSRTPTAPNPLPDLSTRSARLRHREQRRSLAQSSVHSNQSSRSTPRSSRESGRENQNRRVHQDRPASDAGTRASLSRTSSLSSHGVNSRASAHSTRSRTNLRPTTTLVKREMSTFTETIQGLENNMNERFHRHSAELTAKMENMEAQMKTKMDEMEARSDAKFRRLLSTTTTEMRRDWKEDICADLASSEARILQTVTNKLRTERERIREDFDARLADEHTQIREDFEARLEEYHTVAQADLPARVNSLVVDNLANDDVCRAAVDAGVARQHARVANAVRLHVLERTLPQLKEEVEENLRANNTTLDTLEQRTTLCLNELRSEIHKGTARLDQLRALQNNTIAVDDHLTQIRNTLDCYRVRTYPYVRIVYNNK